VTALLENAHYELQTPGIQFLTPNGEADVGLASDAQEPRPLDLARMMPALLAYARIADVDFIL
jgi:hypothetical protein